MGRERRKCIPKIPQSLDFVIPYSYTLTVGHERFLLADEKTVTGGRILIFASNAQLNELFKSTYVFCDGTFSTVSSMFDQLYTFHGYRNGEGIELKITTFYSVKLRILIYIFSVSMCFRFG